MSGLLMYLTPKSSTTSMKARSCNVCFHRPGVIGTGVNPCGARNLVRWSLAMRPAWGSPYLPLLVFNVNMIIVDERGKIILLHDGDGDDGDQYPHVFIFIHGSVEVKVFDVAGHEFCIGRGQDTVEHDFNCGEVCHLGADIAIIGDVVATHGESHMAWVAFFWVIGSDNVKICCLFVLGDG